LSGHEVKAACLTYDVNWGRLRIKPFRGAPISPKQGRKASPKDMIPNEPKITPELVAEHGLKPEEYERILRLIGREPTITELGIFSAMWN